MERAILKTVLLMLLCRLLDARQNLRSRPRRFLVPICSFCFVHKLWNVRFLGWQWRGDGLSARAIL